MTSGTTSKESVDATLTARGSLYGEFREQANIAQNLKAVMADSRNWPLLPDYMREGLEMIQHKISRALNGDPFYDDNWHDIIGYASLIQLRAQEDVENVPNFAIQGV